MVFTSVFSLYADDLPIKVDCKNNICDCYIMNDEVDLDINQIIASIKNGAISDSILIACCYHQIALEFYELFDDLSSLKYNKKAAKTRAKVNDGLLWRSNLNIGINYYSLNEYKQAIKYFDKALILVGEKEATDSIIIYGNLAECYMEIGDFDAAISFAEKSIQIKADQYEMITAKNTNSAILIESKDSFNLVKAIDHLEELLQIGQPINENENLVIAMNNLANANKILNNSDLALKYYSKALEITNNTDTIEIAILLNNIALAYKDQNKHDLSIETLKKSLSLFQKYYKAKYQYDYSANFENFAANYATLQQFDTALVNYQKALINLTNNFRAEDIFQNPNPKNSTLFIYSNPDMIRVLHLKATAAFQYYQKNDSIKYLELANQTYQTAFNFHDKQQQDISTENSRLFQAKNIVPYIENALKVVYVQQLKGQDVGETAFRFIEKNKANVLLQSMNEADALQFANLPDSLIIQEKDLKITITYNNKQLNEAIEYKDTTKIERLEELLFEEKQQYNELINNLENNYPNYYRLKYKQNQTELADVQKQLNDQTALLSYFIGDSSIYTLLILNDHTKLFKIQKPDDWNKVINNFREAVTLSNSAMKANPYTKKLYGQFVDNAHTLYGWLLKQALEEMEQITHLKIIPDAELNYIPFELLLSEVNDTSTVNYKNLAYILKEQSISYHYSAGLMMEQLEQDNSENLKKRLTYGGYAAQYKETDTVDVDLPNIRQLVSNMADFFNGKSYLSEQATKQLFLEDTSGYQILHLGMHGKLNDENPLSSHLVFTKDSIPNNSNLYAADLYNKKLQTNLAVLSACNTGSGALQKGEGVMSLSRAFTYAGCPSLVMSLWSIPEKSSADVLSAFFKNIKNGNAKDVALQQAKLVYLENASSTLSHPINWAGLVTTGNSEALKFEKDFCLLSLSFLFLLGGLLFSILFYSILFYSILFYSSKSKL